MTQPRTKLGRQKKSPRSRYWRKKADDVWRDVIRQVGKCEICNRQGIRGETRGWTNLNAHHIIFRSNSNFRHDLSNGICLCVHCHKWHKDFSPHANREGFERWLKENRSGQYEWYLRNKDDHEVVQVDYRAKCEELAKMLKSDMN